MKKVILFIILLCFPISVFAAVGCDLNDPDRDIRRIFPNNTGYKTTYYSIDRLGGTSLLNEIEKKLGDNFKGLYETIDVPYTVYTIFENDKIIGYIHGINQKGRYGGLQVFLAYNTNGAITNFYYQKLTNKKAESMRSKDFTNQFIGLTLDDFKDYNPQTFEGGSKKVKTIKNPNPDDPLDFNATLRAVKKNLILMDIFVWVMK
jgi:hypothetical protein